MNKTQKLIVENLSGIKYSISDEDFEKYGKDWTNFYEPNPEIILFPKTTKDVQQIIRFANENKIGVVPSGGRTGLSGGAVALNKEIVISLERMNKILDFNKVNQTIKVEAGVITEELQKYALDKGLYYPVDFASRGSSQIGGNIATNAGGIRVVRYGLTRNWITGIKMVTGSGEILETNKGLIKNATGYDLRHLIIGSEGTLGIVTEAIVKLSRKPQNINVIFFAISDIKKAISILEEFQKSLDISAFEFLSNNALNYSITQSNYPKPFKDEFPFYVLIEFENLFDQTSKKVEEIVLNLYKKKLIENDIIGMDTKAIKRIWSYRESITESISKYTPYKNDISVLISDIPKFIYEASMIIEENYPEFEVLWFGHIADGNLHINILKPTNMEIAKFHNECDKVSEILFELISKYNGSISAEHGLGILKRDFIRYSRSEFEISLMKSIKKIFDPNGVLNPNKTF